MEQNCESRPAQIGLLSEYDYIASTVRTLTRPDNMAIAFLALVG